LAQRTIVSQPLAQVDVSWSQVSVELGQSELELHPQ
jgi:hypothetical protein